MITQYEANSLLKEGLPKSEIHTYPSRVSLEIYASMNYFSNYTKHALEEYNFDQAKTCFALAEKLYINGDRMVRHLISDYLIDSVYSVMSQNKNDIFMIKAILPDMLYKGYKKQSHNN